MPISSNMNLSNNEARCCLNKLMKAVELVKVMGDEADKEHYLQHAELIKIKQENELLRKILGIKDEVKKFEEQEEALKSHEIIPELISTRRQDSKRAKIEQLYGDNPFNSKNKKILQKEPESAEVKGGDIMKMAINQKNKA